MNIIDLSYLDTIAAETSLFGGASLAITAEALASGSNSLTLTDTNTLVRTVPSGKVTIGKGKGSAIATGDDPYANVSYWAAGFDKIIVKEGAKQGKSYASDALRIIALDLPNH
ncbi:MAG: hypothetical protein HC929_00695 [Leptolyngbyaceae cyanobacterium SM2_5_2]|nr:hypothetical protein [Leptolyngbyaceae cyanobacterium SM2_5_2]